MKTSIVLRIILISFGLGFLAIPVYRASSHSGLQLTAHDRPLDLIQGGPDIIQGGKWSDDFWIGQLQEATNIDVQVSHLFLKFREQFQQTWTWTAHFASGEFFQTEAISDSVRLAWNDQEQSFFTTGIYTSTVFDPGKSVDWAASMWRFSGIPDGLAVEMRTGNSPVPDETWTGWQSQTGGFMEHYCAYTYNSDETECFTNMSGINSSPYLQYRATFSSNDPDKTIALYEISLTYGIHCLNGSALSIPVPPADLRAWESVIITSTMPAGTSFVIDVVATDGTLLLANVEDGDKLEDIDPLEHPALQLRATFATIDESITPDVDLWGFKWAVWYRIFLPDVIR